MDNEVKEEPLLCYFLIAVKTTFVVDGNFGERTMNVMSTSVLPAITRSGLDFITKQSMHRLKTESGITPDKVQDVVILGATLLGQFTESQFNDIPVPPDAPATDPA